MNVPVYMDVPVYIVENCYYIQNDKFSWTEYGHSIQSVRKNFEGALDVLRAIYKEATQNPNNYDAQINEKQRLRMCFIAGRMQKTNSTNVSQKLLFVT